MLRPDNSVLSKRFILFLWLLMSFQAGYINVGGFVIFGNFVSHVTGTSSQIAMGISNLNLEHIITFSTVLIAFIAGAAFAGHYLARKIEENQNPQYVLVSFVKSSIFAIVFFLSEYFFENMTLEIRLVLIFLLSLACGMQNATCAIATDGFLKPTHMTGLSTDIGINLTKIFGYKRPSSQFSEERDKNNLRIKILASFILGGVFSSIIFFHNGHHGFLFPFFSSASVLVVAILLEKQSTLIKSSVFKFAEFSVVAVFVITLLIAVISSFNY